MAKSASKQADVATSRALLRKHARIKRNGSVRLKKGWTDKKIARKAKSSAGLVRTLRGDLYSRIQHEVKRAPNLEK